MSEMPSYVLDSFAMLAFLENEPGAERVISLLEEAGQGKCRIVMSLINLGEVLYITERERGLPKAQEVLAAVEQLPVQVLPADSEAVFAAAHVKAHCRLSFADAFAAAAAQRCAGVLITGDPEFSAVQSEIRIDWLPKR